MVKFSWSCGASACVFLALIGETQAQTAPTSDWTGFYVGAHIGNATSGSDWKDASGAPLPVPFAGYFTGGGIVGGVQAGYNYQRGNLVLGIEGEASFADIDGGVQCAAAIFTCNARVEALGTVAGRLGYATGDFLVYGKAGGAWLHEKLTMAPTVGEYPPDTLQSQQTRLGLALGGGVEYAFSPLASAKIEYNYLRFGHERIGFTYPAGNSLSVGLDQNIHLIKLGMNYKLSGAPLTHAYHPSSDVPPSRIWDGVYAGVHTGGAWGTSDWKSATGPLGAISNFGFPGSGTADGMIAGGQIGFNRQRGSLVVGGEIDASWSNLDGFTKCATTGIPPNFWNFTCRSHIDALGTFAGRLGWAHDNFLIYGKAGAAWAKENDIAAREDLPNKFEGSSLRWGYVLGTGLEYAFTPAWSGKVEYNYLDFGTKSVELSDQFGNASTVGIGQRAHLFKMGVNYRFGVDPMSSASLHDPLVFKAPQRASDWLIEIGSRYWFSNGSIQKDLYDPTRTTQINSRLIYSDMNGHSAETFARFDHRSSGLFVKGNFGLGALVNGKLHDEDFSPLSVPYSNTQHDVRDSSLRYGSLDVGTTLISGKDSKLGAYLGYRYFYQRARGFGCAQVGFDTSTCGVAVPLDSVGLTETEQWRGAALGLNARFGLSDRWRLEVDAAYLPYMDHATVDNHWLRPEINPAPAPGHGWGTQIEAILNYAVTDRFNVGIGGRYWLYTTDEAATRFPGNPTVSPLKYTSERYGGFLQASYKFGGPDGVRVAEAEEAPPAHWSGWYVGGHLGAGFGSNDWSDPYPPPPTGDRVHIGGALGGAQIGVNYQTGKMVVGAELSGSLSKLEGTQTCFGALPFAFAGLNCENTTRDLGTLTARLGYAAARNLFYVKAGGALGRETYTLNSNGIPGGTLSSTSATNLGWTVGAGVEHALSSRWSVSAEYKYLDFGKRSVEFTVPNVISAVSMETINTRRHLLTMGVNYRFSE